MLAIEPTELQHLASHWYESASSFLAGGITWSILSYGAQTFPVPQNKYGRWMLGWVQRALANKEKAAELEQADNATMADPK